MSHKEKPFVCDAPNQTDQMSHKEKPSVCDAQNYRWPDVTQGETINLFLMLQIKGYKMSHKDKPFACNTPN